MSRFEGALAINLWETNFVYGDNIGPVVWEDRSTGLLSNVWLCEILLPEAIYLYHYGNRVCDLLLEIAARLTLFVKLC